MVLPLILILGGGALVLGYSSMSKKSATTPSKPAADGMVYNLADPAKLAEVKRALRAATGAALPTTELASPTWSAACTKAWRTFMVGMVTLAQKSDPKAGERLAGYTVEASGHSVPSATGLAALAQYATLTYDRQNPQNGVAYMRKFWPNLYAFGAKVGQGSPAVVTPPKFAAEPAKAAA
jgi:hypothetical protein